MTEWSGSVGQTELRRLGSALSTLSHALGAAILVALALALLLNVVSRLAGAPLVGANLLAAWLLPALAFCALPRIVPREGGPRGIVAAAVSGFALAALALGMAGAAQRIGGTEPVLGIPVAARFVIGAAGAAAAFLLALTRPPALAVAALLGGAAAFFAGPVLGPLAALAAFALALAVRTPVALALIAAVALVDSPLGPAALAQSVMRGLSAYVLLAVPLFILAAALLVASDVGGRILTAARALAPRRATALGEANVWASLLFGGISASSIADAATAARLLVPAMTAEGYSAARAAAISAATAILPNVMPPSIALLLAAAASDISVGRLWLAGAFAAPVLAVALYVAVRLTPPAAPAADPAAPAPAPGERRRAVVGLAPVALSALAIVAALRFGIVTAVEAGLVAVVLSALYALRSSGWRGLAAALGTAADQAGRVALLIAAAAPVAFVVATSGFDAASFLPEGGGGAPALLAAVALALVIGTVLDAGAAILLVLPILVPTLVGAGVGAVHAALTLALALVVGGLTPPVGILILVVKEITGAEGVYRAVLPYLAALAAALGIVALVPILAQAIAG